LKISEKITLCVSAWLFILLFLTGDADLGLFFIFLFLGFLAIKELTDHYTTNMFKFKMNIFIIVFFMIFLFFISQRIITFLEI